MDSVQLRDLVKPSMVIFAISTTGQGEMPQNARLFWRTLLSSALKPGLLRKVRFTSFGLGDSSYPRFNVAHRMLHGRLLQLGANAICDRGEGNEQHPEGHSAGFREWIVGLKRSVLNAFPLSDGVEPLPDDAFVEPKWKLAKVDQSNGQNGLMNGHTNGNTVVSPSVNGHARTTGDDSVDVPSADLLPIERAYTANIISNNRVTASDHFQDVRLLDLHLDQPYSYGPGAVAVIYPKNFPSDVHTFINLMDWQPIADTPLTLISTTPSTSASLTTASPLRHLNLPNNTLTLRYLLSNTLDIMSIPRRSFFASLSHFANSTHPDAEYQKLRLLELANPELIDELWDYTTRPKRTILEVMQDFTAIRIPWQYALTVLPIMKGRQFSIASGGSLTQKGRKVELLVAIADPPSPIIKFRRRYGVCTRYISSLQANQSLTIGLQQGYLDVQPSEMATPVLMIGPGTGVAPMRAMVHQRLAWAREHSLLREPGKGLEGDILLFGCRSESADFFFREEWDCLVREEGLTVLTAFSRDEKNGRPRQYVQDLIRLNASRVYEALVQRGGKVYVCGSSGNMPKGVREALVDVVARQGGMERQEAEAWVEGLEKEGRYKQETW